MRISDWSSRVLFRSHGNGYGTARAAVEPLLAQGIDVLLEIDWQGARKVREKLPGALSVFIFQPSRAELERRLHKRGQDSDEVIARRQIGRASSRDRVC